MTAIYNSGRTAILSGAIDLDDDTLRVALLSTSTSYAPDVDNETYVSDVLDSGTTATEFSGTGYARQTLANATITQDNTDDIGIFDADDTTFQGIDGDEIQGVLVYQQVGGDDNSPGDDRLIGFYDGSDYPKPANGSDFVVQWPDSGIIRA